MAEKNKNKNETTAANVLQPLPHCGLRDDFKHHQRKKTLATEERDLIKSSAVQKFIRADVELLCSDTHKWEINRERQDNKPHLYLKKGHLRQ